MTIMFRAIAIAGVLALFTTTPARAQSHDVKGSKDHPLISRYPGSVITSYDQEEYEEFEHCGPHPLRWQTGRPTVYGA